MYRIRKKIIANQWNILLNLHWIYNRFVRVYLPKAEGKKEYFFLIISKYYNMYNCYLGSSQKVGAEHTLQLLALKIKFSFSLISNFVFTESFSPFETRNDAFYYKNVV